jgi:hypothetical protein
MFNARLIALAIDVDLPHCDAPRAARDAGNRKDVAAATRASGKARDRQRCCQGHGGRSVRIGQAVRAMRALGGARRRFERNAQMPTENDRQTWPDTASPRCIPAVRWIAARARYRRPRAGARSRAAPQKRNCAPRRAGKGLVTGAIEGGRKRGRRSRPAARQRGRSGGAGGATYSLALLIVIAPAGVDSGRASGSGDEGSHTRSVSLTRSAFLRSLGSSSFLRSRIAFGVTSTNSSSVM